MGKCRLEMILFDIFVSCCLQADSEIRDGCYGFPAALITRKNVVKLLELFGPTVGILVLGTRNLFFEVWKPNSSYSPQAHMLCTQILVTFLDFLTPKNHVNRWNLFKIHRDALLWESTKYPCQEYSGRSHSRNACLPIHGFLAFVWIHIQSQKW